MSASPAAAAKADEARRLAGLFQQLLDVHRADFPMAQRPAAPTVPEPDVEGIRLRHEKAATAGLGLFARSAKAAAREQAVHAAEAEIQARRMELGRQQAELQQEMDSWWRALLANDPDTVLSTLAEAFEDNEAAAAPLGVDGAEVAVVVLAPPESIVPERMPGTTAAGNLSLRKLPKGERSALYTLAVMGHVLVTVKEALAVAPGLSAVRVVALRPGGPDAYGRERVDCVLAGRWARAAFDGVQWRTADASRVAEDTASELLVNLKAGKELQPIDLTDQPQLRTLLEVVDIDELTS